MLLYPSLIFILLFVDNNQLTGIIPTQLGKLKKLQMLNLGEIMKLKYVFAFTRMIVIHAVNKIYLLRSLCAKNRTQLPSWNNALATSRQDANSNHSNHR